MSDKRYDEDYHVTTRAEKHRSTERVDETERASKSIPKWVRVLLWMLRKCIAPIIMIVMLLAGLYIGYVIMGDQPKEEAFKFSTYKHLWDLIFAES